MKKSFRKLAMFTIVCVAVGAAVLTSCNKEEEVINNVPAMEMKNGSIIGNEDRVIRTGIKLIYYQRNQETGYEYCDTRPSRLILCYIFTPHAFSEHEPGTPAIFRIGANGIIKTLSINSADMLAEDRPAFDEYVSKGKITFTSNGPIENLELKDVLVNDYIKAGTYPIQKVDNTYVITISK